MLDLKDILDKYSGALLAELYARGGSTRAELFKAVKMRLNSLVTACDELERAGFVGRADSGRRNVKLHLAPDRFGAAGFEHRSDALRSILLDISGNVVAFEEVALPEDHTPTDLAAAAAAFLAAHPSPVAASIGLADIGIVDPARGVGIFAANHPAWREIPLRQIFSRFPADFSLLSRTEADMLADEAEGERIFVRVSDGIGCAVSLGKDGAPARGLPVAGELGHTVSVPGGARCRCGNRGCLETVSGMRALRRAAGAATLDELADRAASGDHEVENLLRDGGEALGVALANLVVLTGIPDVTVKRPLALPCYTAAAEAALRRGVIYPFNSHLTIKFGVLARESSALGAARLGRREFFERIGKL